MTNWAGLIRLTDSTRGQCGLYLLKGAEILWAFYGTVVVSVVSAEICCVCVGGGERLNRARLSLWLPPGPH